MSKTFGEIMKMKDENLTPEELRWKRAITGQAKKVTKHIAKRKPLCELIGIKKKEVK